MNDRPFAYILDPFYYAAQPLLNALSDALAACNASQDLCHRVVHQAQLLAMTIVLTNKVERDELLAELDDLPDTVAHWARYRLLHGGVLPRNPKVAVTYQFHLTHNALRALNDYTEFARRF